MTTVRRMIWLCFWLSLCVCLFLPGFSTQAFEDRKKDKDDGKQLEKDESGEVEVDDPKLKKAIDEAIRTGVNWLLKQQMSDGSWPPFKDNPAYPGGGGKLHNNHYGMTALVLFTLLKCDVPVDHKAIVRGFNWLAKNDATCKQSYEAAMGLMAISAKYAPKEKISKKKNSKKKKKFKFVYYTVKGKDKSRMKILLQRLLGWQVGSNGWRYGSINTPQDGGAVDVSVTQYALLALLEAERCKIKVDKKVYKNVANYLITQQERKGDEVVRITDRSNRTSESSDGIVYEKEGRIDKVRGFPYMKTADNQRRRQAYGSMTAAGIVGLLICRDRITSGRKKPAKKYKKVVEECTQGIWDGLAWVDAHWAIDKNPKLGKNEHGYWLYALERVGVLSGLREIGPGHDWYLQGARLLVSNQTHETDDMGFWKFSGARNPIELQDTPYALLFLRKATIRIAPPEYEVVGEE